MTFAHPLPPWALAALIALAAGLAWAAYGRAAALTRPRRAGLGALRFVTLVLLVLILMRPVVPHGPSGGSGALVAVVVDTSASMGLDDAPGVTRLARAQALVRDTLVPELSKGFAVEVLGAGDVVRQADAAGMTAAGSRSPLSRALREVRERYRDRRLAGIVLVSDGGETDLAPADDEEGGSPVPTVTIGVGPTSLRLDREVRAVTVGPSIVDASLVDLTATLAGHGASGTAKVRVLQGSRVIDVRDVRLPADGSPLHHVVSLAPDRESPMAYRVEVSGEGTEATLENNRADVLVSPPGRPRRLLVVEGAPGFEHTFLKRAWQQDPSLQVDSVVRKGRNDQGADTYYVQAASARTAALATGFPSTREALFVYDAIVLANADLDAIPREALEMLAAFVAERGGGLLVVGAQSLSPHGLAGSPLDRVLPVDVTDRRGGIELTAAQAPGAPMRVMLTPDGEQHPVMRLGSAGDLRKRWAALPALGGAASLGAPRPGASVLAVTQAGTGATVPLVAVQRAGRGRALVFGGEASWRWKMQMPSTDRSYETFWRQAARWLSAEAPDPIVVAAPGEVAVGAAASVGITVRNSAYEPVSDAQVRARVRTPSGDTADVAVAPEAGAEGRHVARFTASEPGVHRLEVEVRRGDEVLGTVEKPLLGGGGVNPEFTDPRLNETVLRAIADRSGGRYFAASDAGRIGEWGTAAPVPGAPREFRDVWHNGWSFLLIVLLLSAEWGLRRRWGLR